MRRKDREVTDFSKICDIIQRCHCCRVGFYDAEAKQVYIVPLNFGYMVEGEKVTLYFHGAQEGRKIDLIKAAPNVGFEMDTNYKLNEATEACEYSARFQSIIGNGVISLIEDLEEKKQGLEILMKHVSGRDGWEYPEQMLKNMSVMKLEVKELACKEHE